MVDFILQEIRKDKSISTETAERFFNSGFSDAERGQAVLALVTAGEYETVFRLIRRAVIRAGGESEQKLSGIEKTYFDEALGLLRSAAPNISVTVGFLTHFISADKKSPLRQWSEPARKSLCEMAAADYSAVADAVFALGGANAGISALMEAEPQKTAERILDILLEGKNSNKAGLRKILMDEGTPLSYALIPAYQAGDAKKREAAVRLLLLYKNNPRVGEFLAEAEKTEKSVVVKRLLAGDRQSASGALPDDAAVYLESLLVSGEELSAQRFAELLQKADFAAVAARLFFSVYKQKMLTGMVIVDEGKTLDLENAPVQLDTDSTLKVMHPAELPYKYAFIKQLGIEQPFPQIARACFAAAEGEKLSKSVQRFCGRVVALPVLKNNLKEYGFKLLSRDLNKGAAAAGLTRGGITCVLRFYDSGGAAHIGEVQFFAYADLIKLRGEVFTDGVPALEISKISVRAFSEFLYSVSGVLGCL